LNGIPSTFSPSAHTHTANEITGIVVSLELNDLTNVNANPTSDGDVVSWDATGNTWIARPGSKITGLLDVADIPLPNGYLRWNVSGTEILFEENISAANITGLSSIATSGLLTDIVDGSMTEITVGDSLVWDGTYWVNKPADNVLGVYANLAALQADATMAIDGKTAIITGQGIVYYQLSDTTWYKYDATPAT
jgi:hypothetical protein